MHALAQIKFGNATLGEQLVNRMADIARSTVKGNTAKAYKNDWQLWADFAAQMGVVAMPADPAHVAAFITAYSETRKLATLKRYMNSISSMHTRAGHEFDRHDRVLSEIMRGLRQQKAGQQKRAKPLTAELALKVVEAMAAKSDAIEPDDTRAARDAALLLLGVVTGMRRSELVGLTFEELSDGDGILSVDEDGVLVELFRSKTNNGEVENIFVPNGIAADALRNWLAVAQHQSGEPVFMRIQKFGQIVRKRLTGRSVANIVKKRVGAAGMDATDFSGHSLRAGLVTSGRLAGAANHEIKRISRHKSDAMLDVYHRETEKRMNGLAKKIGLAQ